MDITVLAFLLSLFYILIRIFNLCSECQAPLLRHSHSTLTNALISCCPILKEVYQPPQFWGKNGHFQTLIYAIKGRFRCSVPKNQSRRTAVASDGATVTFDVFEPTTPHPEGHDVTICIAPGIGNNSESQYIRSSVNLLQKHGYRVAVLNHLGTLRDVKLTAPRIYSYGGTEEYHLMAQRMKQDYPNSLFIAVGISMGANVVTKYLGECKKHQEQFLGGMSICQGYDVLSCERIFGEWDYGHFLRRIYYWAMTRGVQKTLKDHEDYLFHSLVAKERLGENRVDEKKVFGVTTLHELDEEYSRKILGFTSLQEYYGWASSARYMRNIDIPIIFLNSLDDPVVPPELQDIPLDFVHKVPNAMSVITQFGGHLGFYEGSYWAPRSLTFMDRFLLQYCDALLTLNGQDLLKPRYSFSEESFDKSMEEAQNESKFDDGYVSELSTSLGVAAM